MPLHTYHCTACDTVFETLVRASDTPTCSSCGSEKLERQLSQIAPDGKLKVAIGQARSQAAKEGHFSNYSKSEMKGKL